MVATKKKPSKKPAKPRKQMKTVEGEPESIIETITKAALNGHAPELPDDMRLAHLLAIEDMERTVRKLELAYIAAKGEAKDAKESFDEADAQLRQLIAGGPDAQRQLDFEADRNGMHGDA